MKKLMIALALTGFISAPTLLSAQEGSEPEGGEWGEEGDGERAKTPQEMMEELHRLMKKASDEMGDLEKELAKASLDSPKADVIAARIQKLREQMEKGELEDMPEGLRKWVEENPDEVAKASGKSKEEIEEIAKSSDELEELLKKNPELLKKLAENNETMESIVERQHTAEKKLEETLKKQGEAADAAKKNVDESLELAHTLKKQGQGQGQGQPKNDKGEKSNDPREKEDKQGGDKPDQPATGQYQPGEGEMKPEDQTEEFDRGSEAGAQFEKQGKDMGDGASSRDRKVPSKYKGFWEKFNRETSKKAEERKEGKTDE